MIDFSSCLFNRKKNGGWAKESFLRGFSNSDITVTDKQNLKKCSQNEHYHRVKLHS